MTIVFDRDGWSRRSFQQLVADGFDILTPRSRSSTGGSSAGARALFPHLGGAYAQGAVVDYQLDPVELHHDVRPRRAGRNSVQAVSR